MVFENMRKFRSLIVSGLLLVVAACAAGTEAVPPKVHLVDIAMLQSGLLEQRMRIDLRIGNPNNFDLPLEGVTFKLEVNDRLLADGFSNEAVVVPRLGEARLAVQATTTLFGLMRQMLALGQDDRISYRISGKAYLSGLMPRSVSFETGGELELTPPERSGETTLVPL